MAIQTTFDIAEQINLTSDLLAINLPSGELLTIKDTNGSGGAEFFLARPEMERACSGTAVILANSNTGDLPQIIANEERLYDGDLTVYFRVLFFNASNLNHPYHNFRHMLHVLWLCHQACQYYRNELSPRQMRILLIAALFHDFDHTGRPHPGKEDPDGINIEIALAALRRYITCDDRPLLPEIEAVIEATHYPHQTAGENLHLLGKIIRDADLTQSFSPAWIQQVVIGLAREWRMEPLAVLKAQKSFLSTLRFNTQWARQLFSQQMIAAKIEEAEKLLWLLEPEQSIAA